MTDKEIAVLDSAVAELSAAHDGSPEEQMELLNDVCFVRDVCVELPTISQQPSATWATLIKRIWRKSKGAS